MKIGICSDHAAYELKEYIKKNTDSSSLQTDGWPSAIQWVDYGCGSTESVDYPDYGQRLCKGMIQDNKIKYGVTLCGTGIGASITANRFKGIRAALCHDLFTAEMSRKHNDANILAMGSRVIKPQEAVELLKIFLAHSFEGGRHERRIKKIEDLN